MIISLCFVYELRGLVNTKQNSSICKKSKILLSTQWNYLSQAALKIIKHKRIFQHQLPRHFNNAKKFPHNNSRKFLEQVYYINIKLSYHMCLYQQQYQKCSAKKEIAASREISQFATFSIWFSCFLHTQKNRKNNHVD